MMVSCVDSIVSAAELMIETIKSGAKILLCGNGGSAADSQHLAAELVSKLKLERSAIPAIALTTNTSTLTAIANDYDFSQIFVRQLEAFGRKNDLLIG
ncbi:MAG: SIS domain-containing protein, partial [Candidatus Marinimicrobia bacterium]|nr:SIS domain-containing protein [Candidatus Neomarinimicrobiota bacterium]